MSNLARLPSPVRLLAHIFVGLVGSTLLGWVLFIVLNSWLGSASNPWTDFPYSPLLWGVGLLLGLAINLALHDHLAQCAWVAGILWFVLRIVIDLKWYDPRWCNGCSPAQFVWYNYFTYGNGNCMQECLGEIFATSPMLNSFAYSIGAVLALRLTSAMPGAVDNDAPHSSTSGV